MRTRSLGFALGAGLALSACATTHLAGLPKADVAAADACADWRWIGITDSSTNECPTPGWGWVVKPLFKPEGKGEGYGYEQRKEEGYGYGRPQPQPTPAPEQEIRTADVVAELSRFCVYETTSSKALWHPPFQSPEEAGLARLDRDCAGISRAGVVDLKAASMADLANHFLVHAGKAEQMTIKNRRGVRLAFLDTQPTGKVVPLAPGRSKHGYTLAHIANRLVCSPQSPDDCAAQITTRLAMPMLNFDRARQSATDFDYKRGGGLGTQGDLADAIYAEVNDWLDDYRLRQDPRHLVLNLSLGWDPQQLDGLDEQSISRMQAGTQAVYQALQYAKSLDVLVLAAAGNRRSCCPQTGGPLLPAAWEQGYPKDDRFGDAPRTPLLYAVGGVRSDGRPLANAREGGMPKRAAYGENGGVDGVTPWGPEEYTSTGFYTGSSVATAVVSATAALVWDTVPGLSSADVMAALDESGAKLGFPADFWFGGNDAVSAPDAHRISVCGALLKACKRRTGAGTETDTGHCPVSSCPDVDTSRTVFPEWAAQPISTSCHPWLVPQPEDPLCPPCDRGP
jgi:subtilase family protein